ncbi:hypothetical protein BT69DRAFT_865679 [Atractiella rhizophila]|nr:hypothetical protein BT69DRAFT_865679 [Atractiella rhizophila]
MTICRISPQYCMVDSSDLPDFICWLFGDWRGGELRRAEWNEDTYQLCYEPSRYHAPVAYQETCGDRLIC